MDFELEVAAGRKVNLKAFSALTGASQVNLTIRREFQLPEAACSSGAGGFLQHPQSPQFRSANQLPQFPSLRASNSDAGISARKRW